METLKDLVIRIAANLQLLVHKPFVQRCVDADKRNIGVLRLKDRLQTIELFLLFSQQIDLVSVLDMPFQVICQDIELLMEDRLWDGVKRNLCMLRKRTLFVDLDGLSLS